MKTAPEPTPAQQSAARLTAWALDELPAPDAAAFSTETAADPALQSEAEAVRDFCAVLEAELSGTLPNNALELSAGARQELETATLRSSRHRVVTWLLPLSAAACFAILLSLYKTAGDKALTAQQSLLLKLTEIEASKTAPSQETGNVAAPADQQTPGSGQPAEAQRLISAGYAYYDVGEFQKAADHFNHALVLDPKNASAMRGLEKAEHETIAYYRVARDHTRAKMIQGVDAGQEDQVTNLVTEGKELAMQGRFTNAKTLLNKALELDPGNRNVQKFLERMNDPDTYHPAGIETWNRVLFSSNSDDNTSKSSSYNDAAPQFLPVTDQPLSTFSIDVDTASYAIARRHLNEGQRPPVESVRLEEMINYFPMDDAPPADGKPFAVHVETASAPWAPGHRLVRVALKGKVPAAETRRPANLVFLVDTSGSMGQPNKLPLVQQSLRLLLDQLEPGDLVTLVTYAGDSELKLPATPVSERARIAAAIDSLTSGGSTNGSGGITTAYQQARAHLVDGGVNRVILATDGDFNVGLTSGEDLQTLIAREAKSGVYLSVLAYGSDNLKDPTAELLADQGNGNYAYIDSLSEARRALVTQLQGTLTTIAKDVKIQVEFNPAQVARYRLLGYENRALANKDFNDDTKDAGEIGAGHSVTALYEIVTAGAPDAPPTAPPVDPLKYQTPAPAPAVAPANLSAQAATGELLTVKLRYQQPEGTAPSQLIEVPVKDPGTAWPEASANFRWSAAVAAYAMLLRDSTQTGTLTWETVRTLAAAAKGPDPEGFRGEFLQLIEKAASLIPLPVKSPAVERDQIRLWSITIPKSGTDPVKTPQQQRTLMEDIRRKILAGEKFSAMAIAHSQDSKASDGGAWGLLTRKDMTHRIGKVVFELPAHELSPVIEDQDSFYLFFTESCQEGPPPPGAGPDGGIGRTTF